VTGLVWLAIAKRREQDRWGIVVPDLLVVALAAGAVSLGSDRGRWSFAYKLLAKLPGFGSVRYPHRFQIAVELVLAVGAAAALTFALSRRAARVQAAVCVAVVALAAFELLYFTPKADMRVVLRPQPVNRLLAPLPTGPVIELPAERGLDAFVAVPRQLRGLSDGKPRVAGYAGVRTPPEIVEAVVAAANLPDPAAVLALRYAGVRYIAVHGGPTACRAQFGPEETTTVRAGLAAQGLRIYDDPSGSFVADLGSTRPTGTPGPFTLTMPGDRGQLPACAADGFLGDPAAVAPAGRPLARP
jgi:hypothetical protein